MASACVNNIGVSPDNFPAGKFSSYGWLSPRVSFGSKEEAKATSGGGKQVLAQDKSVRAVEKSDPEVSGADFEFRLDDPVTMLPADELFSDGKLMPLQLKTPTNIPSPEKISSPEASVKPRRINEVLSSDPYLFSPKAPRCSSRWKELLGLRKIYQNTPKNENNPQKTNNSKSLKNFLHRKSSSSSDASLTSPLLKDSECLSSSRLSLSSTSSEDMNTNNTIIPSRHSLDSDKPSSIKNNNNDNGTHQQMPRVRLVKPRAGDNNSRIRRGGGTGGVESSGAGSMGITIESPRMNSSGKIVFCNGNGNSLERSSSSPSPGGPRFKHRGMERSYSANVRVTPVLNVPVCSLRSTNGSGVFKFFGSSGSSNGTSSSQQRKEGYKNRTTDRST